MSVLSRDLASYQSAVDQYQRNAQGFNNSLIKDANGNVLVYMNGQYYSVPAEGGNATRVSSFTPAGGQPITDFSSYGVTPSSGDPNVMLVRQNPTGSTIKTVTNLQSVMDENGNTLYFMPSGDGGVTYYSPPPGTPVQYVADPALSNGMQTYTAYETVRSYANEPAAFDKKAPDPTNAQLRRANAGSWADAERMAGLDTGIIRGAGLKSGLRPPPKAVNPLPGQPAPAPELPTEQPYTEYNYGY